MRLDYLAATNAIRLFCNRHRYYNHGSEEDYTAMIDRVKGRKLNLDDVADLAKNIWLHSNVEQELRESKEFTEVIRELICEKAVLMILDFD